MNKMFFLFSNNNLYQMRVIMVIKKLPITAHWVFKEGLRFKSITWIELCRCISTVHGHDTDRNKFTSLQLFKYFHSLQSIFSIIIFW